MARSASAGGRSVVAGGVAILLSLDQLGEGGADFGEGVHHGLVGGSVLTTVFHSLATFLAQLFLKLIHQALVSLALAFAFLFSLFTFPINALALTFQVLIVALSRRVEAGFGVIGSLTFTIQHDDVCNLREGGETASDCEATGQGRRLI